MTDLHEKLFPCPLNGLSVHDKLLSVSAAVSKEFRGRQDQIPTSTMSPPSDSEMLPQEVLTISQAKTTQSTLTHAVRTHIEQRQVEQGRQQQERILERSRKNENDRQNFRKNLMAQGLMNYGSHPVVVTHPGSGYTGNFVAGGPPGLNASSQPSRKHKIK